MEEREKIKITFHCCFCSEDHKTEIKLPVGWDRHYDGLDDESQAFCPNHSKIKGFTDSQCPGCVGGWGDCGLWEDFAYREENIDEEDFQKIRKGICPRRVNGTFTFNSDTGKMKDVDLSEKADSESGIALEKAIKEYWETYH